MKNKAFILSFLTVTIPLVFQLIYIRYVSYHIAPEIYGDFVLLSAIVYGFSQLILSIPGQAFSRFYNLHPDKTYFLNEFRTYLLVANFLSIFLIMAIYFIYSDRFSAMTYCFIYLFLVLFNNYTFNQKSFLLSLERKKYFILKILEGGAKYVSPLLMYYHFRTLESFLIGIIIGYSLSSVVMLTFFKKTPFKLTFNLENQKKYFLFAYPIFISSLFSWGMSFSDRFFIDTYLTSKDVAIYSLLLQFSAFGQVLATIYGIYVNPIILKKFEENENEGIKLLEYYLKKFFFILAGSFCLVVIIPPELLCLILEKNIITNDYYYGTFLVLALSVFLMVFQTAMSLYFVLYKKLHIHSIIFGIAAIVNFILNFFIQDYGIIMAAFATLIAYTILNVLIYFWKKNYARI